MLVWPSTLLSLFSCIFLLAAIGGSSRGGGVELGVKLGGGGSKVRGGARRRRGREVVDEEIIEVLFARWVSTDPSSMVMRETSKVPPPRSKMWTFFSYVVGIYGMSCYDSRCHRGFAAAEIRFDCYMLAEDKTMFLLPFDRGRSQLLSKDRAVIVDDLPPRSAVGDEGCWRKRSLSTSEAESVAAVERRVRDMRAAECVVCDLLSARHASWLLNVDVE